MDKRVDVGDLAPRRVGEQEVRDILRNSYSRDLAVEELKTLTFSDQKFWPLIIETAGKVKKIFFKDSLYFYVPLYISNYCVNNCLYCDYRRDNKDMIRKRLSFSEFKSEIDYLFEKGYKEKIELVSGSDPIFPLDEFARYIVYAKSLGVKQILMNNRVLSRGEYKVLKNTGLDWSWLWIESYSAEYFNKYHPSGGEKRNFTSRLNCYDDAAAAGLKIGLGVLLGLSPDWRLEVLSAIKHAKYLIGEYKVEIEFGTPRFCSTNNAPISVTPYPQAATDDVFRLMVALYRLGIRNSYIDGSTRESIDMLRKLWEGGGNLTNPEVETIPGGYTLDVHGSQFSHNSYDLDYFIAEAKQQGLNPVF